MRIDTIGHSTRTLDAFLELLGAHRISHLADVRTVPKSRRHPHFASAPLAQSLADHGIEYRHFPALGGLRKPRADSRNIAWRNEGFRGYADYMETPGFEQGIEGLLQWVPASAFHVSGSNPEPGTRNPAPHAKLVIMCAEAVWWRCHRQLIADALVARGIEVAHITSTAAPALHTLTRFARVEGNRVRYDALF